MKNNIHNIFYFLLLIIISFTIFSYSNFVDFTKLKSVKITGCHFINENDIVNILKIPIEQNLLSLKISEVQKKIVNKYFVKNCRVSKIFPSTLLIEIIENEPIAILFNKNEKIILDKDGVQLPYNHHVTNYYRLPDLYIKKHSIFENDFNKIEIKIITDILSEIKNDYSEIFFDIKSFDFNGTGDVVIKYDHHTKFFFNEDFLYKHFRYLDEFRKTQSLHHVLSNYSTIDLRVDNQIIVKRNS